MLAAWRKRDIKSNEAGVKYFLLGVFASAVMLYGMALLYGVTGQHDLCRHQRRAHATPAAARFVDRWRSCSSSSASPSRCRAVPFHTWAPDTYEGAPTPVTAFLSVASKAAGFVALLELVFVGVPRARRRVAAGLLGAGCAHHDARQPHRAAPDQHRAHAGVSSIAQAGFILMPLAVVGRNNDECTRRGHGHRRRTSLIYAAMNLGAFAVVIAVRPQDPLR